MSIPISCLCPPFQILGSLNFTSCLLYMRLCSPMYVLIQNENIYEADYTESRQVENRQAAHFEYNTSGHFNCPATQVKSLSRSIFAYNRNSVNIYPASSVRTRQAYKLLIYLSISTPHHTSLLHYPSVGPASPQYYVGCSSARMPTLEGKTKTHQRLLIGDPPYIHTFGMGLINLLSNYICRN